MERENELIVNEKFSYAIRFASIIVDLPLPSGRKLKVYVGDAKLALKLAHSSRTKTNLKIIEKTVRDILFNLA